jgi:MOSC domain-containing protein YiiM
VPGLLLSINTSNGGVPKLPRHHSAITTGGVEGDRHHNRRIHGGPDRAVCVYSFDRIRALQAEGHSISVGDAGENLTIRGIDWDDARPGARLAVGDVRLLVTGFTLPCRNIASCFHGGDITRIGQKTQPGWSRVYARVEQPGLVWIGDPVTLEPAGMAPSLPMAETGDTPKPAVAGRMAPRQWIRRTGTLHVACAPADAFVHFTPDGERLWVPGFDPEYLHPLSGEQGPGAIFTTTHGGEETLWMVLRFSPADGVAEYARVTPGSRRGTVRASLEAAGERSTRATVSYDLTALSDEGDAALAAMTESAYAEMLGEWQQRIAETRSGGRR